jgi:hypothetical protein
MPELKINMSETTHHTLLNLANSSGDTIQEILDKAIENYRRQLFLTQANESFLTLRNNETLWQEEIAEREVWDQALADGIDSGRGIK